MSRLVIKDKAGVGVALEAERKADGGVRLYGAAGGVSVSNDDARKLGAWLRAETWEGDERVEELERELDGLVPVVRQLLTALEGAWWLEAAEAYRSLTSWRRLR